MNAQEKWKQEYIDAKTSTSTELKWRLLDKAQRHLYAAALERRIAAQQRTIAELQDRVWQLEAQEHNRDDGNEWEKEYYLRGIHR